VIDRLRPSRLVTARRHRQVERPPAWRRRRRPISVPDDDADLASAIGEPFRRGVCMQFGFSSIKKIPIVFCTSVREPIELAALGELLERIGTQATSAIPAGRGVVACLDIG
jgi:hypothetical protein